MSDINFTEEQREALCAANAALLGCSGDPARLAEHANVIRDLLLQAESGRSAGEERHAFQVLRELGLKLDNLGATCVDKQGKVGPVSDFLDQIVRRVECLEQQLQEADGRCEKLSRRLRLADAALRGTGQGWIPVGERPPEEGDWVLWFNKSWSPPVVVAKRDGMSLDSGGDLCHAIRGFSHWMPRPAPPEVV